MPPKPEDIKHASLALEALKEILLLGKNKSTFRTKAIEQLADRLNNLIKEQTEKNIELALMALKEVLGVPETVTAYKKLPPEIKEILDQLLHDLNELNNKIRLQQKAEKEEEEIKKPPSHRRRSK